jgi:hypothetical protein
MLREEVAKGGRDGVRAGELLLAYGYGRPVQTMNLRKITSVSDLTDDELVAILGDDVSDTGTATH